MFCFSVFLVYFVFCLGGVFLEGFFWVVVGFCLGCFVFSFFGEFLGCCFLFCFFGVFLWVFFGGVCVCCFVVGF